jgi:class 3 adenylate cyclase
MFADISGFTAWSSVREPAQVFTLLEQIYGAFDATAKRRRIFKVETIGDCYVAASGLPEPRDDHAVAIVRFARDCLHDMQKTVQALEVILGPDTAELGMRFGLHSGPVTAGVLRGEKTRFQLFGDTVNTASRIESTGVRNLIHVSMETANLLIEAGKGNWVKPREELVSIKGKGEIQTYWANVTVSKMGSSGEATESADEEAIHAPALMESPGTYSNVRKTQRLIDWNVDVLKRLLQKIVAMRDKSNSTKRFSRQVETASDKTVLDEVKEIITLPSKPAKYLVDPTTIELDSKVISQLRDYVTQIAGLY